MEIGFQITTCFCVLALPVPFHLLALYIVTCNKTLVNAKLFQVSDKPSGIAEQKSLSEKVSPALNKLNMVAVIAGQSLSQKVMVRNSPSEVILEYSAKNPVLKMIEER